LAVASESHVLQRTAVNMPLQLDRAADTPLQDQLCEQLRQLILTGRLKPNTRIIATRFLAEQVGVSRRTVLFAYEQLIAEGYLETRPAIGTFVSPVPPATARRDIPRDPPAELQPRWLMGPKAFHDDVVASEAECLVDFSPTPFDCTDLLPPKAWLRWLREVLFADPKIMSRPVPVGGLYALRQVVADYLAATRGILASPDQVVIVSGRRHACSLVGHMFQHRRDRVVVEDPGDEEIAAFFKARGAEVVKVPTDEFGLQTDRLPRGASALAYVTPARQYPVGGAMPQARRAALIEWARNASAVIVEDDIDADLRYSGSAQPPLIAHDPGGMIFHIGSFARRLGSGVCLGYLLAPGEYVEDVLSIKSMGMEGGQLIEQAMTANFLASGDYDHHLRKLRKIYLERRDALVQALSSCFGAVRLIGAESGTQLTWLLPEGAPSATDLRAAARARGVKVERVVAENAGACPFHDRALILSYAALEPDTIRRGVTILADAAQRLGFAQI
jgi:GntR family transcriptional regulator/MocR family aminotransferase